MGLQVLLPLSGVLIVGIGDTAASMYAIPDPCLSSVHARELRACMAKSFSVASLTVRSSFVESVPVRRLTKSTQMWLMGKAILVENGEELARSQLGEVEAGGGEGPPGSNSRGTRAPVN